MPYKKLSAAEKLQRAEAMIKWAHTDRQREAWMRQIRKLRGNPIKRRKITGAKKKKLRQNPDWISATAVRIRKAGRKIVLDILR